MTQSEATSEPHPPFSEQLVEQVRAGLGSQNIVLIGIMGAGKTSVGRRLAQTLDLAFVDADSEIEAAANLTIPEIFETYGEDHFRDGERRVISRLLGENGAVIATGGGAFMNSETRSAIKSDAISVWLKADLPLLMQRVRRRSNRPLLKDPDPEGVMRRLMDERYPIYAEADLTIISRDVPHQAIVADIVEALDRWLSLDQSRHKSASNTLSDGVKGNMPTIQPAATVPIEGAEDGTGLTVTVDLPGRAYDIVIAHNILKDAGTLIAEALPGARLAIVTDEAVADLHLPALLQSCEAAGLQASTIIVPPGEGSKSFAGLQTVVEGILEARLERGDAVVALGGGVVGDLAGYAAASARRGMALVQIPTTLLAQVDSSVGGKTGINARHGKNLVGAFHQPTLVLADTGVLETLPTREFKAGYAEVAKYGLINNAEFFAWLEDNRGEIFQLGPALETAIAECCRSKAEFVVGDEHEAGERALLNLGHTFGHALEVACGYDPDHLIHGEAVAIGIVLAYDYSARKGLMPQDDADRVRRHFSACGLPTAISHIPGKSFTADEIVSHMLQDKKVVRGSLRLILSRGIGKAYIEDDVEVEDVHAFLKTQLVD